MKVSIAILTAIAATLVSSAPVNSTKPTNSINDPILESLIEPDLTKDEYIAPTEECIRTGHFHAYGYYLPQKRNRHRLCSDVYNERLAKGEIQPAKRSRKNQGQLYESGSDKIPHWSWTAPIAAWEPQKRDAEADAESGIDAEKREWTWYGYYEPQKRGAEADAVSSVDAEKREWSRWPYYEPQKRDAEADAEFGVDAEKREWSRWPYYEPQKRDAEADAEFSVDAEKRGWTRYGYYEPQKRDAEADATFNLGVYMAPPDATHPYRHRVNLIWEPQKRDAGADI
ncbi:hypothetical protein KGF54_002813 [Candida jiufengensis]|uniref:uncharacterized protein n=1 Tax=Candida jiufengensis TaxID=497108 RepID=UPI0022245B8D|nr:uncharacterized protein KGF54_002813 [Candida jiufengensis]KAI5953441.1 hypothetical protein KGF54_002813 [Candida jiufengensis]